jgi:hypothetical protein
LGSAKTKVVKMSMHKIPLTEVERAGLLAHGLDIGTPSQLSDVFRHGVAWGRKSIGDEILRLASKENMPTAVEKEK